MENVISLKIKSLCGLKQMGLIIEPLPPAAEIDGLTTATIRYEVMYRLHTAGIKVLPLGSGEDSNATFLYVNVNLLRTRIGLYAYSSRVALKQTLFLLREPAQEFCAATWEVAQVGTVGVNRVTTLVDKVCDQIDEFIEDYQAANSCRERALAAPRKRAFPPRPYRLKLEVGQST
jgi:hypothetical protein